MLYNEYISIYMEESDWGKLVIENEQVFDDMTPFSEIVLLNLGNDKAMSIFPKHDQRSIMRGIMKNNGFRKIGDWNMNNSGKLDINYPVNIENVPGVIAITVNNDPMFFSATSHYGPRIRDFKHSLSGNTLKARIHSNIIEALNVNKVVSLWVKDTHSPFIEKNKLMKKHTPKWQYLNHITPYN